MGGFAQGLEGIGATALVTEIVIQVKDQASEGLTKLVADFKIVEDSALSMEARVRAGATAIADLGTAIGVAALGVVGWAVAQAQSFQHASQALQSFVGVSAKDLKTYRDALIGMSLETGGSLSELTENLIKVVQAGYKLGEALEITKIAQEAAIATHEQATVTMGPLISVMRAYSLEAGAAANVMDDLIVASRDSGASFQAFATSLQRSATTAVGLGISYKDLLAVTAELSQGQASMYRTGMIANQFLLQLKRTMDDANPIAQQFGFTMRDIAQKHITGLVPTLKFIDEKMRENLGSVKATTEQWANYKEMVRGVFGQGPASDAYLRLQKEGFKGLTEEQLRLAESAGTTARSFKSAEKNYSDSLEAMEHRMQTLGVVIGTGLLPVLTAFMQDISDIITPIAKFAYEHENLTKLVVAGITVFTAFAIGLRVVIALHDLLARGAATVAGNATAEGAAMVKTAGSAELLTSAQMTTAGAIDATAASADAAVVSLLALASAQQLAAGSAGGGVSGVAGVAKQGGTVLAEDAGGVVLGTAAQQQALRVASQKAAIAKAATATATTAEAVTPAVTEVGTAAVEAAPKVGIFAMALEGLGAVLGSIATGIGAMVAGIAAVVGAITGVDLVIAAVIIAAVAWKAFADPIDSWLKGISKDGIPILSGLAAGLVKVGNAIGPTKDINPFDHMGKPFDEKKDLAYGAQQNPGMSQNLLHLEVKADEIAYNRKKEALLGIVDVNKLIHGQEEVSLAGQIAGVIAQEKGLSVRQQQKAIVDATIVAEKNLAAEESASAKVREKAHHDWEKWFGDRMAEANDIAQAMAHFTRNKDSMIIGTERHIESVMDHAAVKGGMDKAIGAAQKFDIGGGPALDNFKKVLTDLPPSMQAAMQQPLREFHKSQQDLHASYLDGLKTLNENRTKADQTAEQHYEMARQQAKLDGIYDSKKGHQESEKAIEGLAAARKAADQAWLDGVRALKKTFDTSMDTLRHGLKEKTSDVGFGKTIESVIPAEETAAMEGLVGAIAKSKTALEGHIERVHQADVAQELLTQVLIKADKAVGHWADALTKITGDLDKKLADAMGHLTIDLHDHSGNIRADTAAAIHQQTERNKWTDAQTLATQKVTLATGDFAAKQGVVQAQSTTAFGKLADAFLTGKGNIEQLGKKAAEAAEKVLKFTEAMARSQLKSGDFATAQSGAQTLSTIASGRVSQAERLGTGNLPELTLAAIKAAAVVDTFTVAAAKAALATGDFAQQTSGAQTLSTRATNLYAEAIYKGAAGVKLLETGSIAAAEKLFGYTEAQRIAAMHLAENVGTPASKLSARTSEAQGNLNDALAIGAEQVRLHGHMTAEASLAIGASREALYLFSNAAAKAAASGPPTDFASGQAAAQTRLTLSTNDLETALMHGSGGIKELEAAVRQAAEDVKNYAKIHRQGLLDVAQATGDYRAVVANKGTELADKAAITLANLEHAVNTGGGGQGELAAAVARAAKFVDQHAQKLLDAAILVDKAGHQWATAWEDQAKYLANGEMKRAINMAAQDIQKHGKVGKDTADQLERAYEAQETISMKKSALQDAEDAALERAALALGDFSTALDTANKIAQTAWKKLDSQLQIGLQNPDFRPKIPETPAMRQSQGVRIAEGLPSDLPVAPTLADSAIAGLPQAAKDLETGIKSAADAARIELPFRIQAAKNVGDWATAVALSTQLATDTAKRGADTATAYFLGMGGSLSEAQGLIKQGAEANETQRLAQIQTSKLVAQADIDAAIKAGDLGHAFDLLTQKVNTDLTAAFSLVEGDIANHADPSKLATDIETYKGLKAAQEANNAVTLQANINVGNFSAAVSGITSKLSTDLSNATGALAISFYQTGTASDANIATAQAARIATEKFAQAQWDASFATASASEQTKMLAARFSGLISENSTRTGAQASVDNAKMAEVAAEGAVTNALMQEQVTATNGIASILSAQTALLSAVSAASISAIDSQTSIMQAESTLASNQVQQQITLIGAMSTATVQDWALMVRICSDQLKIDQDNLATAKLTAQMNRAASAAAVTLAQDQLILAKDKAAGDNTAAAWAAKLAMDHLVEARIQTRIALDNQKIALDQLSVATYEASAITGVDAFGDMITQDLARLNADQQDMLHAQQQTAADQQQASADAVASALLQAQDQLLIGQDNAGAAALKDSYGVQLAQLKQQTEADNEKKTADDNKLKLLQAIEQNTGVSAQAGLAAAKATVELLQQEVLRKRVGLDRTTVTNTGELDYLNGWSSGAYANGGLPSA